MKMKRFFTIMVGLICLGLVVPAEAELVGHWKLDGDLSDATVNGNDGTVVAGAVGYADGVDGSAVEFDGADSVSLPVTVGLDWSVECWYQAGDNGMFLTAGIDNGWNSLFIRPWGQPATSRVTGAMDWADWYYNGGDGHFGEWEVEWDLVLGVWHHVVVTYSGDGDNTWTFYVDGIKKQAGNIDFPGWYNSQMTIGGAYALGGLQYQYTGLVDEVKLYNHTLTEVEVFALLYPNLAATPTPEDRSTTFDKELTLQWSPPAEGADPVTAYDVYLGVDPNEDSPYYYGNNKIASGITSTSTPSGTLEVGNTYIWRVDVIDPNDGNPVVIGSGLEWTFNVAEATSRGLVGHWTFDGDLSDSIEGNTGSAFGNAYAGTDNGVDGGGAAVFDGDGDAIILSTDGLGARFDWTLACWVKGDTVNDAGAAIWAGNNGMFMNTGPSSGYDSLFIRYYYSNLTGVLNYAEWTGVGGSDGHFSEFPIVGEEGLWHHIAASYAAITGEVQFFVNGILINTCYATFPGFYNDAVVIGAAQQGDGALIVGYDGLVDDVRLYDYALEELEVARIMNPEGSIQPSPADGATNVARNAVFSWTPDEGVESFQVYMTSDSNDVPITARDPSLLVGEPTESNYDPDPEHELEWGTHYYWCVDEVHEGGAIVQSDVWEFTVAASLTCDALLGDLDDDCLVTILDLAIMSENWLECSYNNEDCPY